MSRPPDLAREAAAAEELLATLREAGHGDDDALLADTVEGECGLHEAASAMLRRRDELLALHERCKERAAETRARGERFRAAAERIDDMLLAALGTAGLGSLRLAEATVTARRGSPRAVVTDEAALPADLWRERVQRSPDMEAIGRRIATGETPPGVSLRNGAPSLSVRRR